jgi:MATE family multidrug resistance protein
MNTKGLLISSVIAAVCYFVVYILFRKVLGNHALWLAFDTYLLARGVVEAGLFWRLKVKD